MTQTWTACLLQFYCFSRNNRSPTVIVFYHKSTLQFPALSVTTCAYQHTSAKGDGLLFPWQQPCREGLHYSSVAKHLTGASAGDPHMFRTSQHPLLTPFCVGGTGPPAPCSWEQAPWSPPLPSLCSALALGSNSFHPTSEENSNLFFFKSSCSFF